MTDTSIFRKNKINLEDYDYEQDIQNRVFLSNLSSDELKVLQEIVYSSQRIPILRLSKQLEKTVSELSPILEKLEETKLYRIELDEVIVDKEMRKYFEIQIQKFDEDFTPGIDFLQSLLKKVPIHVLPNWYPIPRTSNNIFHSLIEKYLETPQTFQRYLSELSFGDSIFNQILTDIFTSPGYKMYSEEIRLKYALPREQFEEYLLYLEFNLVCCLAYEKEGDEWVEVVTAFKEWKDYLSFLKESQPNEIEDHSKIEEVRPYEFAFTHDLSIILELTLKEPLFVRINQDEEWIFDRRSALLVADRCEGFDLKSEEGEEHFKNYMVRILQKLLFLKMCRIENHQLFPREDSKEWLQLPIEKRALHLYNETLTHYAFSEFSPEICTERNIREIERSLSRILDHGWVLLDEFLKGVIAPISEKSKMLLQKKGRNWKYSLPDYTEEELALIRKVVYEWLFEAGIIMQGSCNGREALKVTSFGRSMFG